MAISIGGDDKRKATRKNNQAAEEAKAKEALASATALCEEMERATVEARLWQEFDRLNEAFFNNTLVLRELHLSTRKQYGGYCIPTKGIIVLSWLAYQDHGWQETLTTFRHEVAHLVHADHSKAFWELAERLGCDRRYALPPRTRTHAYSRYTYECAVCNNRVYANKRLVRYSCAQCDTAFNPDFMLRLVDSSAQRKKAA